MTLETDVKNLVEELKSLSSLSVSNARSTDNVLVLTKYLSKVNTYDEVINELEKLLRKHKQPKT